MISNSSVAERWAMFDGCCGKITYLRKRQRDDRGNAPRVRGVSPNNPTSRQHSLRAYPGGNTYLMDRVLEGCGC